ncbi:hypothetical protein SAMN04487983_103641 [Streptomyces sp. yr375]|uniref:hypothetical protein n=1 Tax=Streptomyces sp. yr375 TaxID=1761906 RepID=UPI0008AE0317|nr:hypothetical protein [Streptomyces sp. yr375]SES20967.1 hypothetical protein SAMN04487983_103641 [Streptomyces sp. yr375]
MIKQVSHQVTGFGAADLALALDVAHELHAPVAAVERTVVRAPEVAAPHLTTAPQLMGLRVTAARPHLRKVPLNRLAAMRG